jgi:glycerol dehydrogenase
VKADQLRPPHRKMFMPSLYLQGKGAIYHLGTKALPYGDKAYVAGGKTGLSVAGDRIRKSLTSNGIEVVGWNDSVKECTHSTIDKLVEECKRSKGHFIIGVGGGRAIDAAKAAAWKAKVPSMTIGTQCATNADASGESVVYTDDHRFLEDLILPRNPVLVIEDTEIISKAPTKYMVQGMGDALSCKFESEAFAKSRQKRGDGDVPTTVALTLGNQCYRSLLKHGEKAVSDNKHGILSLDVVEIIEAVKLSSALTFENSGCALAHALHNGFTKTGQVKGEHGEIVAFTTIVQMAFENRPRDEIASVVKWCNAIGLPTKLAKLGTPSRQAIRQASEHACERDHNSRNMPDKPKVAEVIEAIARVEAEF